MSTVYFVGLAVLCVTKLTNGYNATILQFSILLTTLPFVVNFPRIFSSKELYSAVKPLPLIADNNRINLCLLYKVIVVTNMN